MQKVDIKGQTFELEQASEPVKVPLHYGDKVHIDDACRILKISRQGIYLMIRRGDLCRWCLGSKAYIPWSDIERVLREGAAPHHRGGVPRPRKFSYIGKEKASA